MNDLTICILTHNRKQSFFKCLDSILENQDFVKYIFINCDDDSIKLYDLPKSDKIYFFKYKFYNYASIYSKMIDICSTKYMMFLEDDDELLKLSDLSLQKDLYINHYVDMLDRKWFLDSHYIKNIMKVKTKREYINFLINSEYYKFFQMSQMIFNVNLFDFPKISDSYLGVFYDWYLLLNIKTNDIQFIFDALWKQNNYNDRVSDKYTDLFKDEYLHELEKYKELLRYCNYN
jgi:hypothetical protein